MKKLASTVALLLLMASAVWGQLAYTTVADTLRTSLGGYCSGSISITNPDFYYMGVLVKGATVTSRIINGALSVRIVPGGYAVTYLIQPTGCAPTSEYWSVPLSASPVNLNAVRTLNPPATPPAVVPTIAATTSALKGDGIGNAIAVTGTGTDCVKVNGSSGACGSGSGTVTVVGAGSLTSTNIVTGGGTTTLQTPSAAATVDGSGNLVAATGCFGTCPDTSGLGGTGSAAGLKSGTCSGNMTGSDIALRDCAGVATIVGGATSAALLLAGCSSCVAISGLSGLGTGVATALAATVSGTGGICLASGSACSGGSTSYSVPLYCHTDCFVTGNNVFSMAANNVYLTLLEPGKLVSSTAYSAFIINSETNPVNWKGCLYSVPSSGTAGGGASVTLVASGSVGTGAGGGNAADVLTFTPVAGTSYYMGITSDATHGIDVWLGSVGITTGTGPAWPSRAVAVTVPTWSGGAVTCPATTTVTTTGAMSGAPNFYWTK